jgi:hypothetical protein
MKFLGKISWTAEGRSGLGNFADRQVPIRVQHEGAILRRCLSNFLATVTPNFALPLGSSHNFLCCYMKIYLGAGFFSGQS